MTERPETGRDEQLRRALTAIRSLRTRVQELEGAAREPIAVVGMGCRLPGAESPQAFWHLLREGVDAVTRIPREEARAALLGTPGEGGPPGSPWGAFLREVDRFDAEFFGIAPVEAERMDPQQRLLLEVAWEAMEDAGQPAQAWRGKEVGVFIGAHSHSNDYALRQLGALEDIGIHTGTGTAHSILANRLSYHLDWRGPSLTVDTACSSSLVALHLAVRSLRAGECRMALAGGVNLVLSPEATVAFSRLGMLAEDGRCKTFDARADGFVRGEGCGLVVLKRLTDALESGDSILALIAGSAVNQDGATNGLTAPNGLSQREVLRAALADAGADPSEVTFVEAHGTGTVLGDPIEVEALADVLGRSGERPCLLGSVKTNIGHLEGAAGIAGFMKTVLALKHGEVPPNLHFTRLNPHLSLEGTRLQMARELQPWGGEARLAGVSSFGFGGTNAHLLLRPAPSTRSQPSPHGTEPDGATAHEARPDVLTVSARGEATLAMAVDRWVSFLEGRPSAYPDICSAAARRRDHHPNRVAVVAASCREAAELLRAGRDRGTGPGSRMGSSTAGERGGVVFVFSGQGGHWTGMARDLLDEDPVFQGKVAECDAVFRPLLGWSVADALAGVGGEPDLGRTDVVQPLLFTIQVGLVEVLSGWGIRPDAVVGHSVGEAAAAHAAGALTLAQAASVVHHRSRLVQGASGGGGMVAVNAPMEAMAGFIEGRSGSIEVAARNAPDWTVLSGTREAVDLAVAQFEAAGTTCRRIAVEFAFHSKQMEPFAGELSKALRGLQPSIPHLTYQSTVTARPWKEGDLDGRYWARNLREPVRFFEAVSALASTDHTHFVEIGPHPILASMIPECGRAAGKRVAALPSLRRERPARGVLLDLLAALHVQGWPVAWDAVFPGTPPAVPLPSYPWHRRSYWFHPTSAGRLSTEPGGSSRDAAADDGSVQGGTLPGRRLPSALPVFECATDREFSRFLGVHRLDGVSTLPASALLAWVTAAAAHEGWGEGLVLRDVEFLAPVVMDEGDPVPLQLSFTGVPGAAGAFQLHQKRPSETDGRTPTWDLVSRGVLGSTPGTPTGESERMPERDVPGNVPEGAARQGRKLPGKAFYGALRSRGMELADSLRGVAGLALGMDGATVEITVPGEAGSPEWEPGFLVVDAALQAAAAVVLEHALQGDGDAPGGGTEAPFAIAAIAAVHMYPGLETAAFPLRAEAQKASQSSEDGDDPGAEVTVRVYDRNGQPVLQALGIRFRSIPYEVRRALRWQATRRWTYRTAWREVGRLAPEEIAGSLSERLRGDQMSGGVPPLREAEATRALEGLAAHYVCTTLRGWDIQGPAPASPEGLAREARALGIPLERLPFWRRVRELAGTREKGHSPPDVHELLHRFPEHRQEIGLLDRCGRNLAGVLLGETDPLELLFTSEDGVSAEALYRDAPSAQRFSMLAAEAVAREATTAREDRPLRILEVGAGTGATTAQVLERLAGVSYEYHFTDVSPSLVSAAESRFAGAESLRFEVLDIESGSWSGHVAQPPEDFDVVLASNVLHATAPLRRSLGNVRGLLRPGGLLVVQETTDVRDWVDLVFGMTPGWWRFREQDPGEMEVRSGHPLLSTAEWVELLRESGFHDPASVPQESHPADAYLGSVLPQALLLARAPESEEKGTPPGAREGHETGVWVLLSSGSPLADGLARLLEERGDGCVLVSPGAGFRWKGGTAAKGASAEMDPDSEEDLRRMFREAAPSSGAVLRGVVDLRATEGPTTLPGDGGVPEKGVLWRYCPGALRLARALAALDAARGSADAGPRPAPRMWIVTAGVQPVGHGFPVESGLPASALWGLGRSLALQYAELWGGLVDVSPGGVAHDEARTLLGILDGDGEEDQHVIRGRRRWVLRLTRFQSPGDGWRPLDQAAVYLVTGGLGALGREVARWLVGRGARNLVLTARRVPSADDDPGPPGDQEARARADFLRWLPTQGVDVRAVSVDAGDPAQVEELVGSVVGSGRRLGGVVHAVGTIDPCPLPELDRNAWEMAFHGKAKGARLLLERTRELDPDFFVLFSSTAAWLGSPELAPYAAANHVLSTLAQLRAFDGLHALAVDWGTWEHMDRLSLERQAAARRTGMLPMPASLALDVLDSLLDNDVIHCSVAHIDWTRLPGAFHARRRSRVLMEIVGAPGAERFQTRASTTSASVAGEGGRPDPRHRGGLSDVEDLEAILRRQAPGERRDVLAELVQGAVQGVLGTPPGERVDPRKGLFDMGMDSLMSVQLRERLEGLAGTALPATLTLNYPTVDALVGYLWNHLGQPGTEPQGPPGQEEPRLAADIAGLSAEESRAQLLEELQALGVDDDE